MKKLLIIAGIMIILGIFGFQYFSEPAYTCEHIIEPTILGKEDSALDKLILFSIDDHVNMIKSPENIQRAIKDFSLDDLYAKEANPLQEEIASMLEVERISNSNKISIKVGSETEEKAMQISYALVNSYANLQAEKSRELVTQFLTRYKAEFELHDRNTTIARNNLIHLVKKFGVQFEDPYTGVIYPSEDYFNDAQPKTVDQLSPEQQTQYAVAMDRYNAELDKIKGIESSELMKILVSGPMFLPLKYHNFPVKEKISTFMNQRNYSNQQ